MPHHASHGRNALANAIRFQFSPTVMRATIYTNIASPYSTMAI